MSPWILYHCGKLGLVVISGDDRFRHRWTHVQAMMLGKTAAFCFTQNDDSDCPKVQANSLISARKKILFKIANDPPPFIVGVGKSGILRELGKMPEPSYTSHTSNSDWESYMRAKAAEDESKKRLALGITKVLIP